MDWDMAKTISVTEARNRFGSVLSAIQSTGEPVIVVSRGKPVAAFIAFRDYEELQRFRAERGEEKRLFKTPKIEQ